MKFKRYSSIENGHRELFVKDVIEHSLFPSVTWSVEEKIDGANYSFLVDCDTLEVRPAKRSSITSEDFFDGQAVFNKYKDAANVLAAIIKLEYPSVEVVQIYGELFGIGIQNRVFYGEKDFKAFDIRITLADYSKYLNPVEVAELCELAKMPTAPVLATGLTFSEAMAYSPVFNSVITPREGDNFVEGVVLKPSSVLILGTGARVVIKNKSDKYKEKSSKKKTRKTQAWSADMNDVYATLSQYNNENRIRSAISKLGKLTNKDFGLLLKTVSVDILEDWGKEHEFFPLAKKDQKSLTSQLNKDVATLIRVNFLNIIDGVF